MKNHFKPLVFATIYALTIGVGAQIVVGPGSGSSGGGGGSAVWGAITGTLSDQTDLQTALDLKAPLASPTFTGNVGIETAGVRLTAADGALTLLGLGNGNDENIVIDLDNGAANSVVFSSGTAANLLAFGTLFHSFTSNSAGAINPITFNNNSATGRTWLNYSIDTDAIGGLRFVDGGANESFFQYRGDVDTFQAITVAGATYNFGPTTSTFPGTFNLVSTGVNFAAADGVLTLLGLGNGNDENLTLDFDNGTANTVGIASGTGVTTVNYGTILVRAPGTTAQVVSCLFEAVATGSVQIPIDDTIPQNNEGDEYMTCAITPKTTTSKLVINVSILVASSSSSSRYMGVALFQDSTADALAAASMVTTSIANTSIQVPLNHAMTSGTVSATTFKVRAGLSSTGTVTFNGGNATRFYGAIPKSSMIITEIYQ